MIAPAYIYRGLVTRVIDADTFVVTLDLGLRVTLTIHVRVKDLNAPEMSTPAGRAAQAAVLELFRINPKVLVQTYKDQQSFSRWIADVYLPDGTPFVEWYHMQFPPVLAA